METAIGPMQRVDWRRTRARVKRPLFVLLYIGIGLHFLMILAVVTHSDEWMAKRQMWQPALAVISRYSLITFSNRNFGFFAPSVTPDWNLSMKCVTESGQQRNCALRTPTREMEVKLYSMLGHFSETDDTMDLFARSWAVHVMNEDRQVVRVEVEVTRNYIPSMGEYRQGKRVAAEPYYRTTFDIR